MDGGAAPGLVMLPAWEMATYLFLTVGSHLYSFYEVHRVSQSKSAVPVASRLLCFWPVARRGLSALLSFFLAPKSISAFSGSKLAT